jgi:hypothetical protein
MKKLLVAALSLLALTPSGAQVAKLESNLMPEMRARVLALHATDIGLTREKFPNDVWGTLMETGFEDGGAYSLVVLADGTTSIYLSRGGAVIGAGQHQTVRSKAKQLLLEEVSAPRK